MRATTGFCDRTLGPTSIYRYLHDHGAALFPDEAFADLFQGIGRESVPPRIVAVVMVLQRLEGLSDREAAERLAYDLRWKYAAGGLDFDAPSFVHTVLVRMRAKLHASVRPARIFEVTREVARAGGLLGRKRVLDSTPLYDAVATQDTVTLVRAAIRGVLRAAAAPLEERVRGVLHREDDYVHAGKPACTDWADPAAREALVDALCRDGTAVLEALADQTLPAPVAQAAALLATVLGQDIEQGPGGGFRIARRVAPDRVISTVDPEARHGHKSAARGFDGYKGHISLEPDSEIITAVAVTAAGAGDASAAEELLAEARAHGQQDALAEPAAPAPAEFQVYGDAAYGTGPLLAHLEAHQIVPYLRVQPPSAPRGQFSKEAFHIALEDDTVTCPNQQTVPIRRRPDGAGRAQFARCCSACPLRAQCTTSASGRLVQIHAHEASLQRARQRQRTDPRWRECYRQTRPKVERKLAHLVRRRHGGRGACRRGRVRVALDWALRAAAVNLQRLASVGCPAPVAARSG